MAACRCRDTGRRSCRNELSTYQGIPTLRRRTIRGNRRVIRMALHTMVDAEAFDIVPVRPPV
jgi:hypothetical protein